MPKVIINGNGSIKDGEVFKTYKNGVPVDLSEEAIKTLKASKRRKLTIKTAPKKAQGEK